MAGSSDMADLAQHFAKAAELRQQREEEAARKIEEEEAHRALEARCIDDPRSRESIQLKYWEPDAPIFWNRWGFKPAAINLAKTGNRNAKPYGGTYPYNVAIFWCCFAGFMTIFSCFYLNDMPMTLLYIMTFGSFIGYAGAFPKLLDGVFATDPTPLAWLGAFCGSLSRVAGGFLSDYIGGAVLTQIAMTVEVIATIIAGIIIRMAQSSDDASGPLAPFIFFILVLFTATGVGNASTFKQMAVLTSDDQEKRGRMHGFSAVIAAYGAFVIPTIFGAGIGGGFIGVCFYFYSLYYIFCGVLNYWYYARPGAPFPC